MTTKETQGDRHHNHLMLPCFPSCENCLSWSDDALALAGGPNVYLMRRTADVADSVMWTQDSLRVDTFPQEDRPELRLATISKFSLGEEQSDPVVVALAWSSSGLGLHRRAVLAVLTSNLLLSIFETNGSPRGWRRSCIFNHYLPPSANIHLQTDISAPNAVPRIRSFAWSHPYPHPTQPKLASHLIAVTDTDNRLHIYSIAKKGKHDYGQWSIKLLCTMRLDFRADLSQDNDGKTTLQRSLSRQPPIRSMSISRWQDTTRDSNGGDFEARAVISCQHSYDSQDSGHLFEITIHGDISPSETSLINTATLEELPSQGLSQINNQPKCFAHPDAEILYQLDDASEWERALTPSYCEYSNRNHLNGLVRLRFWGKAASPAQDLEAAAVTLHPWDTYEYTPPASERCHLVFRPLGDSLTPPKPVVESEDVVVDKILEFILNRVKTRQFEWNSIDRRLLQAYRALVSSRTTVGERRDVSRMILEILETAENGSLVVSAEDTIIATLPTEFCTMCGTTIEMKSPISTAACLNGHLFTRCNLSLISIQQPRISKHCSGCKRQFLDISKLGPLKSPSLAGDLFDEFDVCPYCHEKYEG